MAYFKGMDSPKVVVQIAIEIQRHFKELNKERKDELEKYKPKIGIDFGEVLFAQYYENFPLDPHGLVVDRAARMVSLAKPLQILIPENIKNLVEGKISIDITQAESRKFKGIKEGVKICEVIWDEEMGPLGIKSEKGSLVSMISADEPNVFRFIEERNLLMRSKQIDLSLYTYETLASAIRYKLQQLPNQMIFRVLIRNPLKDSKKEANIKSSIGNMAEVISENPKIRFDVRFYDCEPLLRMYIFHKDNSEVEGLLGFYKYDQSHKMRFVGAEHNYLIHTKDGQLFEKYLLNGFQNRFDYNWDNLTVQKAVIFDLDGVLVDSMHFHYQAWSETFDKVGIDISEEEVYEREGEPNKVIAMEVYKKYKGQEPNLDILNSIIETKKEVYKRISKVQIIPGILELLTSLKDKNVKLGIVTGSTSIADTFQQHKEFLALFDVIITGEDAKKSKPAPDPYNMAVEELGISKKNSYVVENAPLGIKSAVAAGLTCFAVRGPSPLTEKTLKDAGAHFVYRDIAELKKHLVWVDTNIHMKDFLSIFGSIL
jgi:beta-phosphoglucomutase